ncbi:MAG: IS110 family transposase, partial [Nocardioidaceae bacterium]|nr:IS110 family transposase [Nocardioidaceae bacterium]
VRDPRGRPVMPGKRAQILREWDRLQLVRRQLRDVELQMNRAVAAAPDESLPEAYEKAARIAQSKGIGAVTALTLALELFGWREFRNRREVGSVAGLVPTPYNTGESAREQGISKAGNARVRRVMIEAAWSWLRYQPESALSKWFNAKFAAGKRKKGIVALARKLLIAFWRVAETGVYPEGTVLKSTRQAKGA